VPAKMTDSKNVALPAVRGTPDRGSNARLADRPRGDLLGADNEMAAPPNAAAQMPTLARSAKGSGLAGKSRRRAGVPTPSPRPAPGPCATGQIQQPRGMGFSEEQSREALAESVWDWLGPTWSNKALDLLFTRCVAAGNCPRAVVADAGGGATDATSAVDSNTGVSCCAVTVAEKAPASPWLRSVTHNGGGSPVAGGSVAENSTIASTASTPRSACGIHNTENVTATKPMPTRLPFSASPLQAEVLVEGARVGGSLRSTSASLGVGIEVVAEEEAEVPTTVNAESATAADLAPTTEMPISNVDSAGVSIGEGYVETTAPKKRIERCLQACPSDGESTQLACDEWLDESCPNMKATRSGYFSMAPKGSSVCSPVDEFGTVPYLRQQLDPPVARTLTHFSEALVGTFAHFSEASLGGPRAASAPPRCSSPALSVCVCEVCDRYCVCGPSAGGYGDSGCSTRARRPSPLSEATCWVCAPADGLDIGIRERPDIKALRTGEVIRLHERFMVSEEYRDEGTGVLYLRLADGRGWAFDVKPGMGPMCVRATDLLTIRISLLSGHAVEFPGLAPTMTLSALHAQAEEVLKLPRFSTRFIQGSFEFRLDDIDLTLSALGVKDGTSLTCVLEESRRIPCPVSGWEYLDSAGVVQGPFGLEEMSCWYVHGYFSGVPMRYDSSLPFVVFEDLFPEPLVPFHMVLGRQEVRCTAAEYWSA